jgi:hypothetical protein
MRKTKEQRDRAAYWRKSHEECWDKHILPRWQSLKSGATSMPYRITTQKELRRAFWEHITLNENLYPGVINRKITDYSGTGKMYNTDTRCAWCDWIDSLSRDGTISPELTQRATLD